MIRFSKRIGDCTQVNSLEEHYGIRNRFSLKRLAWAVTCVTCKIPSFSQNKRQIYSSLWKSWLVTRTPFLSPLFIYSFWLTYGLPPSFFSHQCRQSKRTARFLRGPVGASVVVRAVVAADFERAEFYKKRGLEENHVQTSTTSSNGEDANFQNAQQIKAMVR